jgi:Vta1 like
VLPLSFSAHGLADLSAGKYQVVNQILAKDLHNADQESMAYTTRLMDDLEQVRCSTLQQLRR